MSQLVNEQRAAEILALSVKTLQDWRVKGKGPGWAKMGRSVRYRTADLEQWIESQLVYSTSETSR